MDISAELENAGLRNDIIFRRRLSIYVECMFAVVAMSDGTTRVLFSVAAKLPRSAPWRVELVFEHSASTPLSAQGHSTNRQQVRKF